MFESKTVYANLMDAVEKYDYEIRLKKAQGQLLVPDNEINIRYDIENYGELIPLESIICNNLYNDALYKKNERRLVYEIVFYVKKMISYWNNIIPEQSARYALRMINSLYRFHNDTPDIVKKINLILTKNFICQIKGNPVVVISPLVLDASLISVCEVYDLSKYDEMYSKLLNLYLQLICNYMNLVKDKSRKSILTRYNEYNEFCHTYCDELNYHQEEDGDIIAMALYR